MRKTLTSLGCALFLATSAFAADTVPWSNDFAYSSNITGYKKTTYHNSSYGFNVSSGSLYVNQSRSNFHNEAWMCFTVDGFQLEKGKGYKFEMDAYTNNTTNPTVANNFQIMLLKHVTSTFPSNLSQLSTTIVGADGDAIKAYIGTPLTTIISGENLKGNEIVSYTGYFEVEENGVYDLCLYLCSDYNSRAIYFDNFKLSYGSMDAPDVPTVKVTPDANGVLKSEISVTAPSKTIRGEALTSISKMEILRDGGLVKELTNPTPGSAITFTDYVAQPGNHTYSAIAYNDFGPGQQADAMVTIGGTPSTQTWDGVTYRPYWAKYTPDGKIRIEWPAVHTTYRNDAGRERAKVDEEGLTYKVQTVSGREITGEIGTFTIITHQPAQDQDREVKMYYIIDDDINVGTEPIGWQYKVSTINEAGTETHRGYTNYLCLNNEVPYYPNMKSTTSLDAFTKDMDYSYGCSATNSHASIGLDRPYGYSDKNYFYNNWLISPGLKLSKDKFYRVKVTSGADNDYVTYTIKVGKGSYREALDKIITEDRPTVVSNSSLIVKQTDEMFLSVDEDGMYFVGIMPSIVPSITRSTLRIERFDIIEVDPTLPDAPTDVTVAYSPTNAGKGTISYTVPTKTINGEDVEGLTKIEILKNGEAFKTVTENVTPGAKHSFDIDVTPGKTDTYTVLAFNAAGQGESASATVFVLSTPYSNDFSTKNALNGFTQINNLKNGQNFSIQLDQARLFYSETGHDIWLITPPITLTKDQYYQLNYNLKSTSYGDDAGECTVMLGKAPSAEALTQTVKDNFLVTNEQNIFNGFHEDWFTVEESGQYFLGFHFTKEPGRHTKEILLDNLSLATGVAGTTPAHGVLKVTPAADATKKATLSYTVPTKALNGTDLTATSTQSVYFYINNVQTAGAQLDAAGKNTQTFNAYPGQTVSIDIVVPEDLPYIFSARSNYNGRPTYVDAFIGLNIPAYPQGIVLKETQPYGHVQMSWDAVTKDYEGYDMNPANVRYEVMKLVPNPYNPEGNPIEEPVITNINGTSVEFDAIAENAPQTMMRYVLRARAAQLGLGAEAEGKGSEGVLTPYVNVGKPYRMPYQESFSSANQPGVRTAVFSETLPDSEGPINWGIMTDGLDSGIKSADGDGCYLAMEVMWLGGKGRFYTGKVNLSGVDPVFSFMLYNPSVAGDDAPNILQPMIYTIADGKWHEVAEAKSVSELTNNRPGWNKVSYDLSKYADQIAIVALDATCMKHTFTSIDNLKVWEAPATDFSFLGHNTPISVNPGQTFNVDLKISNSGKKASKPESIEMYVDGNLAQTLEGTEIGANDVATVTFTHSIPAVDIATSHELKFKINSEADADSNDNETSATIATVNTHLATVENLTADVNNDTNIVTLNWDAPKGAAEGRVTEDFEKFEAGQATQFGWTSYDRDGRILAGINDGTGSPAVIPGLEYHGKGSWAVIDLKRGPFPASTFPAVSGDKFLMSMVPDSEVGSTDDWLISPPLSGKEQNITFWVRNIAGYRIGLQLLYSEGGMTTDDFKEIETGGINYDEWQGIRFTVPEGAKRFAIRNISYCEESWMAMLDDISYDPAVGEEVALQGYNVYSENECLAQPTKNLHILPNYHEKGEYVYGVSARYAHGESAVVPVKVSVLTSGVTEVSVADGIHIFGGKGCIHVTGAEGENVTVYDLNGQVLANGEVSESGQIAAAPGVYVVVAGGHSQKVLVK